jgi:hypothetical protein
MVFALRVQYPVLFKALLVFLGDGNDLESLPEEQRKTTSVYRDFSVGTLNGGP